MCSCWAESTEHCAHLNAKMTTPSFITQDTVVANGIPASKSAMTQHPNRFNKYLFTRVIGSPTRVAGSLLSRSKCHTTLFRGSPWAVIMQRALMCCQPTRGALNTNTAGNNNKKAVGRDDAGGDACTSLNRLAPHTPQNLRVPLKFRLVPTSRDSSRCLLICAHT